VRRPAKIAVTAIAMYLTLSLAFGILMARLTLFPMRLALPDRARIARMYNPTEATCRPPPFKLSMESYCRVGTLCRNIKTGRRSFCSTESETIVAVSRDMVKRSCARAIAAFCCPIRAATASAAEQWQPAACSKATMFGGRCHGSTAKARCVDGCAEAMGAALVLESLRSESRFCAVVADSPFSDFRSVAYDREGYFVGAGRFRMERIVGRTVGLLPAEIGFLYARWRYGVDLRRANPVDAVKSSIVPVLLIHGEEEINILPWHSRTLAQADPVHAQLWLVPGAGHCGAVGVAPDEFWSRVLGFFARHNGAQPETVSYRFPTGPKSLWPSIAIISKNKSPGLSLQGCWRLTSDSIDTACLLYRRAVFPRCQAYLWQWSPRRAADSNRRGPLTGVTGRLQYPLATPSRLRPVHNYVRKMASLSVIYEHRQRSEMGPSNAPVVV